MSCQLRYTPSRNEQTYSRECGTASAVTEVSRIEPINEISRARANSTVSGAPDSPLKATLVIKGGTGLEV